MLARFSIRTKITTLVAALLLAISGLGALGLLKMQSMNTSTVEITTNWLPTVTVLGELRAEVVDYRLKLRDHLLATEDATMQALEKELAAASERIKIGQKGYEALISSPEEKQIYDSWRSAWDKYTAEVPKVLDISRKSNGAISVEGVKLLSVPMGPFAAQMDEAMRKDIDLNNKGAAAASAAAAATYSSAFFVVLSILGLSIAFGIVASVMVIRDVASGIAAIIKPMQTLGQGDLSADVPYRGVSTEIGAMADALQVFKEALIAKKAADAAAGRDAEEKIERGRRVDAITRNFESMIGGIVQTVSSASTELEASAGTLTATSARAQELTTAVAAASEEASTNVQSV
ncbi:MCP four helix bundle domain-containing protein, partial [Rhodopseudomonas palustris]